MPFSGIIEVSFYFSLNNGNCPNGARVNTIMLKNGVISFYILAIFDHEESGMPDLSIDRAAGQNITFVSKINQCLSTLQYPNDSFPSMAIP